MICPSDEQTLFRILGTEVPPKEARVELDKRTRMYHCAGGSGPIGVLAVIDMVRFLGLEKAERPEDKALELVKDADGLVEWRKLPTDGSIKVMAFRYGKYLPGSFKGFVQHGSIAVVLDNEPDFVHEILKDQIRLFTDLDELKSATESNDEPEDALNVQAKAIVEQEKVFDTGKVNAIDAFLASKEEPGMDLDDEDSDFDWSKVQTDVKLYVQAKDDVLEGKFKGYNGVNITVDLGDAIGEFSPHLVALAGE